MPTPAYIARSGLLASLSAFAASLATSAQLRLQLLALDVEEQRLHFFSVLARTLVAAFCLGLATVLATAALVVTYWFTHRLLVLGVLAVLFLFAGIIAAIGARHGLATCPALFASSREQLELDKRQFTNHP
ncbi:MAG: phage holin family protein [Gammaproteobacteria bacterium]|nr:phage holin family protein [Gammaproteobacteria bacterium]